MNFVADVLERFPASRPALVALSREGERRVWHFGELVARSAGLSGAFAARGVRRGDAVMTLAGNRIEWVLSLLACWRMGAIALPCTTQLRRGDLEARVAAANPALCVGEEELLGEVPGGVDCMTMADVRTALDEDRPQETPADLADLAPTDPALIVFTSGTTGAPRGALHSQRYLAGQALQAEHWYGPRAGELAWCTATPGWSKSSRNSFVAAWLQGAAALLHDARFDPAERLEIAAREGVNVLCQAPTEYRMMAARTALGPLPEMRRMVSAGEALDAATVTAFADATGVRICDGYGQTETGALTGVGPDEGAPPGSMGMSLPRIELRLAGAGGDAETGELQLRAASCPTFFDRYLDAGGPPELIDGEWWATGDLVRRDGEGTLWYLGRADDLIVSSGYRIGPDEVESALAGHPAVAEAAAVGAPDAERGAVVRAIVVLAPGHEPTGALARELQEHAKRVTAPYKHPRIVEFAESLPRTPSGKLRRAELRRTAPMPRRPAPRAP